MKQASPLIHQIDRIFVAGHRWFAEHKPTVVVLTAAVFGQQLHLPEVCRATDPRGSTAHWAAGAHQ
jgi:hypothetical protein